MAKVESKTPSSKKEEATTWASLLIAPNKEKRDTQTAFELPVTNGTAGAFNRACTQTAFMRAMYFQKAVGPGASIAAFRTNNGIEDVFNFGKFVDDDTPLVWYKDVDFTRPQYLAHDANHASDPAFELARVLGEADEKVLKVFSASLPIFFNVRNKAKKAVATSTKEDQIALREDVLSCGTSTRRVGDFEFRIRNALKARNTQPVEAYASLVFAIPKGDDAKRRYVIGAKRTDAKADKNGATRFWRQGPDGMAFVFNPAQKGPKEEFSKHVSKIAEKWHKHENNVNDFVGGILFDAKTGARADFVYLNENNEVQPRRARRRGRGEQKEDKPKPSAKSPSSSPPPAVVAAAASAAAASAAVKQTDEKTDKKADGVPSDRRRRRVRRQRAKDRDGDRKGEPKTKKQQQKKKAAEDDDSDSDP